MQSGMRIKRDRKLKLMFLSQEKYIAKVLDRFNMTDAQPLGVPLPPYTKLSKADCPKDEMALKAMKGIPYASTCGSLMYAMVATRPDIAYAVGVVSRFMSNVTTILAGRLLIKVNCQVVAKGSEKELCKG